MRLREVARATGLDEDTIRRLERKGVIQSSRDANGWRIFDPSVVNFLRRRYSNRVPSSLLEDSMPAVVRVRAIEESMRDARDERTPMQREIDEERARDAAALDAARAACATDDDARVLHERIVAAAARGDDLGQVCKEFLEDFTKRRLTVIPGGRAS
jgi:DNA-binding transcriptional MerR regulator